jgi:hypothetical protein
MSDAIRKHGNEHGPLGTDPIRYAEYHCILKRYNQAIIEESPAFVWHTTRFMPGYRLIDVQAGLVTPGSDVEIAVYNATQGRQMLATNLVIAAGDEHSDPTGLVYADVETDDDGLVAYPDTLHINVVDAGGGAKGLEVVLVFL